MEFLETRSLATRDQVGRAIRSMEPIRKKLQQRIRDQWPDPLLLEALDRWPDMNTEDVFLNRPGGE